MSEGRKDHLPRPNAMLNSLEPEAWEIGEQTLAQCQSSSVLGILQARILEWVAMPSSRGSSQPRNQTQVSHTVGRFFTI